MTTRPQRRTSGPHQPVIDAYLADLEHALSDLDANERDDVVASVREHIDTALIENEGEPTVREVEALLGQLGSVDQIAQDAGDGTDRSGRDTQDTGSHDGWIPLALAALSLVLSWFPFVAIPLALGAGIAAAGSIRGVQNPAKRRHRIAIALSVISILIGVAIGVAAGLAFSSYESGPIESGPTESGPTESGPTESGPAPTG